MIFSKNLELMQFSQKAVARYLASYEQTVPTHEINGSVIFEMTDGEGQTFYSASTIDPIFEASVLLDSINLDNRGYVVLGMPSTSFFEQLLDAIIEDAYVIVVEKDPGVLRTFLSHFPLDRYVNQERCKILFFTGRFDQVQRIFEQLISANIGFSFAMPEVIRTFPTYRVHSEFYTDVKSMIYRTIRDKSTLYGNQLHSTLKGISQEILNLPDIVRFPRLKHLRNLYQGKPIICVSSGPSLDKQLPMLRELQGKVPIIAAVSSFNALVKNGIEPDIVCVLERGPQAYDLCFKDENIPAKTWLFTLSLTDSRLFKFWPNVVIPCIKGNLHAHFFMNQALGDFGMLVVGLSVAHMNLMLAHYLGASEIIFVGQDLAFADSGKTHSQHTIYEKLNQNKSPEQGEVLSYMNEIIYVNGYYGGEVKSKRLWEWFLKMFEEKIMRHKLNVINCTEGGASIRGTVQKPFAEVFDKYKNESFVPLDTYKEELFGKIEAPAQLLHQVYRTFKDLIAEIEDLIAEAEMWTETVDHLQVIVPQKNDSEESYLERKLTKHVLYFDLILQKIKTHAYLSDYFGAVIVMHHIRANATSRITNVERAEKVLKYARDFLAIFIRGGKLLCQTIELQFQEILPANPEEYEVHDVEQLVNESISTCLEYIPNLITACDTLAEQLRNRNPDWIILFGDFMNGIKWVIGLIEGLKQHQVAEVAEIDFSKLLDLLKKSESLMNYRNRNLFIQLIETLIKMELQFFFTQISRYELKMS